MVEEEWDQVLQSNTSQRRNGVRPPCPARGGPLIFQRNGAIMPGRVAATWPNEMIAAGNIS